MITSQPLSPLCFTYTVLCSRSSLYCIGIVVVVLCGLKCMSTRDLLEPPEFLSGPINTHALPCILRPCSSAVS